MITDARLTCAASVTDGFSYGSTSANWATMARFAKETNLIFVPSVGPGYDDRKIRPWYEEGGDRVPTISYDGITVKACVLTRQERGKHAGSREWRVLRPHVWRGAGSRRVHRVCDVVQ